MDKTIGIGLTVAGIGLVLGLILLRNKPTVAEEPEACLYGKVWSEKSKSCVCPSGTFWKVWPCFQAPCPGECAPMDQYVLNEETL